MSFFLFVLTMVLIVSVLLAGQQLLLFDCGVFFLGAAAFYAWGAYGAAILSVHAGCPPLLSIFIASVGCAVVGGVLGYPLLTLLQGDYLAMATLGLAQLSFVALRGVAPGGSSGMAGIPGLGFSLTGADNLDWLIVATLNASACFALIAFLRRRRFGFLLRALRSDENVLASLGFSPLTLKLQTLVLSAFFAGLAGAMTGHFVGAIEPGMSSIKQTVLLLCGTILSGRRWLLGPLIGGLFLLAVPELIQRLLASYLGVSSQVFSAVQVLYAAVIVIIAFTVFPRSRSELALDTSATT